MLPGKLGRRWASRVGKGRSPQGYLIKQAALRKVWLSPQGLSGESHSAASSWSGARELEYLYLTYPSVTREMGAGRSPRTSSFLCARKQTPAALRSVLWQRDADAGRRWAQNGKGIQLTASAQGRLDVQHKRNRVTTSVPHRTGLWEAPQLDTWRRGPERLSDLPRVAQVAVKFPALVYMGEVHLSVQSPYTLFHAGLLTTLGLTPFLWMATCRESFTCHRILETPLPSEVPESPGVSSGWH